MKLLKFYKKLKKKCRIQSENHKKTRNHKIQRDNYENQKNIGIPHENHTNHEKKLKLNKRMNKIKLIHLNDNK